MDLKKKVLEAEKVMRDCFLERNTEIRLMLISVLTGQNLLLLGPPGVAKSALLNTIGNLFQGRVFNKLLGKFTDPSELFGPYKLSSLQEDKLLRNLNGFLADTEFAFLDEVFKSNSAVLNTLLQIMNEKTYTEENRTIPVPLKCLVGASNELPSNEGDQKGLGALLDRFLIRVLVNPIKNKKSLETLITKDSFTPKFKETISLEELKTIQDEINNIKISDNFKNSYVNLLKEKIFPSDILSRPSDRRIKQSIILCKAEAWLEDSKTVENRHGLILKHVLWNTLDNAEPLEIDNIVTECFHSSIKSLDKWTLQTHEVLSSVDIKSTTSVFNFDKKCKELTKEIEEKINTCVDATDKAKMLNLKENLEKSVKEKLKQIAES